MGFMDKLKNIFFEEEEDEIEEPVAPKKEKKVDKSKEEKLEKREILKNTIAKKVELPKRNKSVVEEEIEEQKEQEIKIPSEKIIKEEPKVEKNVEIKPKRENRINTELIFDDEDFSLDVKPKVVKEKTKSVINKDTNLYKGKEFRENKAENKVKVESKMDYIKTTPTAYSVKEETKPKAKTFTPSPIISPIYGILDKNYKKEEVKENKEIRISSRPSRMDLDSIRNKAFGDLEYDLMNEYKETENEIKKEEPKTTKDDMKKIYNSKSDDKPAIEKVTIGEADEYYNDLGLAYNTDYKDLSKDINDGKINLKEDKKKDNLEDNLFDLIESMYDKEE